MGRFRLPLIYLTLASALGLAAAVDASADAALVLDLPAVPGPVPAPYLIPYYEQFPVCQENSTAGPITLTISGSAMSKTSWKGWGTSLAWFANYIGGLPKEHLNVLLDLMFNKETGLGLNIVRYNIGGGPNPNISTQFNRSGPEGFYGIPGFKDSASGEYNWSSDANQRAVLLGARDRGADTFIAFSNSPPWWMTKSGDVAGNTLPFTSNINSTYYAEFADYLTTVVQRYKLDPEWNITFESLEPFNEAVEGPWMRGYNQEGCHMEMADFAAILPLVSDSLWKKGLETKLIGFDSWTPGTLSILDAINGSLKALVHRYDVHSYWFPSLTTLTASAVSASIEDSFGELRRRAEEDGKELWQSEWCALWRLTGSDMDLALVLARTIMQSVNILGASAWVYWQAIMGVPVSWTLIDVPWDYSAPFTVALKPNFWVLKHFTTQVPQGSFSIGLPTAHKCQHCVAAFYDPKERQLAVFVVNHQASAFTLPLELTHFGFCGGAANVLKLRVFRTSHNENVSLVEEKELVSLPSSVELHVSQQSLVSVLLAPVVVAGQGACTPTD